MTRAEAIATVEAIVNAWPGPTWTAEQMRSYASAIEDLDYEIAQAAIHTGQRDFPRRPMVSEFRTMYRDREAVRRPPPPPDEVEREPIPPEYQAWLDEKLGKIIKPMEGGEQ